MIDVVWGAAKDKPESSRDLAEVLSRVPNLDGYLYIGYPIIGSPLGPIKLDALLLSKTHGLVAFDLVEALDVGQFELRQDEIASMLEVKLKPYPDLKKGRDLKFDINVVTYAPAKNVLPPNNDIYYIANSTSIVETIERFSWGEDEKTFSGLVAAVQVVTSIRSGRQKREPKKEDSRGARLKKIEDSIANLDQHQSQAVIETVDGVQRIRGLAGSGKTIILALKVAYLHAQYEDWRIAVTFNTRSLKEQFKRLITNFTIEQTGSEPDWDKVDILNAWGAPGTRERDGIYHKYCREHSVPFIDFASARRQYGEGKEFAGVCANALSFKGDVVPQYDMILVDEAQDLPPDFLRLCYKFLRDPKRLVYAYDELQSLTGESVLPPEEIFGVDDQGRPLVRLPVDDALGPRQDVILEKCYRNSAPVLATAHALGFGIYRDRGLVQFFDQDSLWADVGYVAEAGEITGGNEVVLARTSNTSPLFLENHSPREDLIKFLKFDGAAQQAEWLVKSILEDIKDEELRPEDIVVINTNPLSTQREVGPIRTLLLKENINSELAGVSTSTDVFTKAGSVTFTGIFRAKGNEAGMVYIINAQDGYTGWSAAHVALVRNRLFTAITRSKAWVRVLGVGANMELLIKEGEALKNNDYKLRFTYPTAEEKQKLRLINRDLMDRKGSRRRKRSRFSGDMFDDVGGRYDVRAESLVSAAERGDLDLDRLMEEIRKAKALRKNK
jgi:superfamily I DNA and RNA helicase